jgi:NAD(P)-dependent dehydrogenase (short-subunit alcohol dehydrogenase family)
MKTVVITGVSTGIGYASAKILTEEGTRVFGSVRTWEDAERLKQELGDLFVPLIFDVTDEAAVRAEAARVGKLLGSGTLDGLVNNAGIEVAGPLAYLGTEKFRYQLDVNLLGPFIVSKAFIPLLGSDPARNGAPGRIINISSTSGRIAGPFAGAYAASKFGLEGFSDSLRRELILFGIDVIVIQPGAVLTPIWQKSDTGLVEEFRETPYAGALATFERHAAKEGANGYPAAVVGNAVRRALTAAHPKARYSIVPRQLPNWIIPRLMPVRLLDKLAARFFGIVRIPRVFTLPGPDNRPES